MGYYNSFVVRIWSNEQGQARGRIEHVSSHDSLIFVDLGEIDGFIRRHLLPPDGHQPEPPVEWSPDLFPPGKDTPDD